MKNIFAIFVFLLIPAIAQAWPGTVLHVSDGDTITVAPGGDSGTPVVVRLYGIDAPEKAQPGGQESKAWLQERLPKDSSVEIVTYSTDKYGRAVSLVVLDKKTINADAVSHGQAWVYDKFCKMSFCRKWKKAQKRAKKDGAGLWADANATSPWKWREEQRESLNELTEPKLHPYQ